MHQPIPRTNRAGRRATLAATVAVIGSTLAPALATADSISFLRGGNIWVANADGSGQLQLTTRGGYSYQSRADDGSFIALHGRQLHRLTATGQLVAEFNTPVSFDSPAGTSYFRGPFKPEISPDGTKVAYEYYHQQIGIPGCTPTWECNRLSVGIGYSYPDRNTSWDESGLGRQSGWTDPSWIDNHTLLMSDKSVRPNPDAIIDRPGDGNNTITQWFEADEPWYLRDGEISRRGDAAAFVATKPRSVNDPRIGQQNDEVAIYRMTGAAPALPQGCFGVLDETRILSSPSFAADGHAVAFESEARHPEDTVPPRIEVLELPDQSAGCSAPAQGSYDLIADAEQPDWSPADLPTLPTPTPPPPTRTTTPTPPPRTGGPVTPTPKPTNGSKTPNGTTPGNTTNPGGSGSTNGGVVVAPDGTPLPAGTKLTSTQGGATLAVPPRRLTTALRRGIPTTISVPARGRLTITATYRGHTIARSTTSAKRAATLRRTLAINAAGRRSLRNTKHAKVSIRITFTPKTGPRTTGKVTLTLGR